MDIKAFITSRQARIAAILLLALIVAAAIWLGVSNARPAGPITPTPEGKRYNNPDLGLTLYYPEEWMAKEQEGVGMAVLASSLDVLTSKQYPARGMRIIVLRNETLVESLKYLDTDMSSAEAMIESLAGQLPSDAGRIEPLEPAIPGNLSGFPSASAIFLLTEPDQPEIVIRYVVVLSGELPTVFLCETPRYEWEANRATFEAILATVTLEKSVW
jgi:hypothetical protein